jgi:cell division protein FtsB
MAKWKRNNYKFWHSPIALVIIFCIFILFGYNIIGLIQKEKETSHKKELILDQINNLQEKKASLTSDIAKLETEEGKEEIIREKYEVTKLGEKMVTIVDEDKSISQSQEESSNHGFWNWIKKLFKK